MLFAIPAAGTPAPAQETEPPKARLGLPEGPVKPVHFVHSLETVQDSRVKGEDMRTVARSVTELSIEVGIALPEGRRRGLVRFGRCRSRIESPLLGTMDLDSASPLPESGFARIAGLGALCFAESEFPVTLDAGGKVAEVGELEDAVEKRAKALGLSSEESPALRASLTAEKVARVVDGALVATPLPAKEVTAGHSWEDEDVVPGTSRKSEIRLRQTLRLERVDAWPSRRAAEKDPGPK